MKKRKIGIVGTSNSGKTMLLTSLLWHLGNHDPDRFKLKNGGRICNFRLIARKEHDFAFQRHKNMMLRESRWPEKSMDFAIAQCRFRIPGRLRERQLTFVDIPGERISDILIWKSKDYRGWVDALDGFWDNDPVIEQTMKAYREVAARTDSTLPQLTEAYKRALWGMLENFCQVTPSTYFLDTGGSLIVQDADKERAIRERPVWKGGELLPLPESWGKAHPAEYRRMTKIFRAYREQVLKPLFREIDGCDNFIFCVDIPEQRPRLSDPDPADFPRSDRKFEAVGFHAAGELPRRIPAEAGLCRYQVGSRFGPRPAEHPAERFCQTVQFHGDPGSIFRLFRLRVLRNEKPGREKHSGGAELRSRR